MKKQNKNQQTIKNFLIQNNLLSENLECRNLEVFGDVIFAEYEMREGINGEIYYFYTANKEIINYFLLPRLGRILMGQIILK